MTQEISGSQGQARRSCGSRAGKNDARPGEGPGAGGETPAAAGKLIVVGASAGGVPALMALAAALPPDLPAAVLVVLHGARTLPDILAHAGPLPAEWARDGQAPAPGRVYVAPPDRHLVVRGGLLRLSHGPKENHTRPAIDPLLRTAAHECGPGVAAVILSGTLGDGARGAAAVRVGGGLVLVQDPQEAAHASMPRAALAGFPGEAGLPVREIARRLAAWACTPDPPPPTGALRPPGDTLMSTPDTTPSTQETSARDTPAGALIRDDIHAQAANAARSGANSVYVCPECGGVLWQVTEDGVTFFQCHTGHTYAPRLLLQQKSEALEATLWAAVRLLTEKATLTRQLLADLDVEGDAAGRARVEAMAALDERNRAQIEAMLDGDPNPTGQAYAVEEALDAAPGRPAGPGG